MGGLVFDHTRRIELSEFHETWEEIEYYWFTSRDVPRSHYSLIGSSGKKESMGDIDVAILMGEHYTEEDFKEELEHIYGRVRRIGSNIFSVAVGIVGDSDGAVQVDFIMTKSVGFSKWMYHSERNGLKGLYRNDLLSAISNYAHRTEEDGVIKRVMLNYNEGTRFIHETFFGKNGQPLKNSKRLFTSTELIRHPEDIRHILFGQKFIYYDILSFDEAWECLMDPEFEHGLYRLEIIEKFKELLAKKGLDLPEMCEL